MGYGVMTDTEKDIKIQQWKSFSLKLKDIIEELEGFSSELEEEFDEIDTDRIIGQPWLEVAQERIDAGEPEENVMLDYGYKRVKKFIPSPEIQKAAENFVEKIKDGSIKR